MAFWVLSKLIAILYTHILEISERNEEIHMCRRVGYIVSVICLSVHIHYRMFPKQKRGRKAEYIPFIAYRIMNVNKSIPCLNFCVPFLPVCRWWLCATQNTARNGFLPGIFCVQTSPQLCVTYIFLKICNIMAHTMVCAKYI